MKYELINLAHSFVETGLTTIISNYPHHLADSFGNTISTNVTKDEELNSFESFAIKIDEMPIGILKAPKVNIELLTQIITINLKRVILLEQSRVQTHSITLIKKDLLNLLYCFTNNIPNSTSVLQKALLLLRGYTFSKSIFLYEVVNNFCIKPRLGLTYKEFIDLAKFPQKLELLASVIANQNQILCCDPPDENTLSLFFDDAQLPVSNYVALPISSDNKTIGVLVMINNQTQLLDEQIEFLDYFAKLIGLVISENQSSLHLHTLSQTSKGLESYVDNSLLRDVVSKDPENMVGVEKNIVVLFVKIDNFSHIQHEFSSKGVINILNYHFDLMSRIVEEHSGTIDKVIGDVMMAVWGHSNDIQNPNELAIKAAIEMQKTVINTVTPLLANVGLDNFAIGIGLNSGSAIAGNIGAENFMDYTVVGDTINLAQRLSCKAKSNEIWANETTIQDIKIEPSRKVPNLKVKGKKVGVNVVIYDALKD